MVELAMMSPLHLGLLGVVLLFLIAMLEVGIIESAYQKLGMSHRAITLLLLLSVFGSYVNIPIARISSAPVPYHYQAHVYNLSYVPALTGDPGGTIIAINLGGAVIPILLSAYLLLRVGGFAPAFVATAIVALLVHHFARIVPGAGISVPTFVPGFAAAILAIVLVHERRPVVAYVAGTMGCLIGADVANLGLVAHLNAPVAAIGGAGTFDGVFVSGIIAVLLA
jgi:uncharacterized membrane protein